jgi:hypothetical protein
MEFQRRVAQRFIDEPLPPLPEAALAAAALAELRHGRRAVGIETLKRIVRNRSGQANSAIRPVAWRSRDLDDSRMSDGSHRWFSEKEQELCPECGATAGVRLPETRSFLCLNCGRARTAEAQPSSASKIAER